MDGLARRPSGKSAPVNRAMARCLEADPCARFVIRESAANFQCRRPRFDAGIAVVAPAMVIAELLESTRPLGVLYRQLAARPVVLQASGRRVQLSRSRT